MRTSSIAAYALGTLAVVRCGARGRPRLTLALLFAFTLTSCQEATTYPAEPPTIESFAASTTELPIGGGPVRLTWIDHGSVELSIAPDVGSVVELDETTVQVTETTTFTLTASNDLGTASASVTIVVGLPDETEAPPTIAAFIAAPSELPSEGGAALLSWTVDGATTVTIDPNVGDVTGTTEIEVNATETTTYTLSATNQLGTVTAETTVTVAVPDAPPTIHSFTSDDASLAPGGGWVRLSWNVSDASTLSIEPDVGNVAGTLWIDIRVTETTVFKLTASNVRGSAQAIVIVQVETRPPPQITSFVATPALRTGAGYVTLSWTTAHADTISINQGVGDVTWELGSTQVWVTQTTTYTLSARSSAGQSAEWSTTVFVE